MTPKSRSVCFVLLGVAALVLEGHYSGSLEEVVRSYGGNIAASFAVYFLVSLVRVQAKLSRLSAAGLALAVVELFEATNGFGLMTNVYDRLDFVANAVGVALALGVDLVTPEGQRRVAREGDR